MLTEVFVGLGSSLKFLTVLIPSKFASFCELNMSSINEICAKIKNVLGGLASQFCHGLCTIVGYGCLSSPSRLRRRQ